MFAELELTYANFLRRKENRKLKLVFHFPNEEHHDVIFTDPYRLKQIINNLYLNALKHTDFGTIEVGYTIVNETRLRFFVSDTGAGIPENRLKNIFKRFNYTEEPSESGSPGTGAPGPGYHRDHPSGPAGNPSTQPSGESPYAP